MHRPWRSGLTLTAAVFVLLAAPASTPAAATDPADVRCIAHRGGSTFAHTEETEPTYAAALAAGVVEVEGDVRFTRTGNTVLLHDATLGQFGAPTLAIADLSTPAARAHLSPTGDQVATLWEVRTLLLANPQARAQLELKVLPADAEQWANLASRLDGLRDRVTLAAFSLATVRAAQDHGYRTAWVGSADTVSTAAPTYVQATGQVDAAHVAALAALGVEVHAWTPNTEAAWQAAADAGVVAIITDDPLACMTWTAGTTSPSPTTGGGP